jgi:hypothetical protein
MRPFALVCTLLLLAFMSISVDALAGGVCIEPAAVEALSCRGAGKTIDAASVRTAPSFHSAPPRAAKASGPRAPAPNPSQAAPLSGLVARQRALLVVELDKLSSLFGATPRNAPDRLTIARRMADGYVELEAACFRDKTEAEIRRDGAKKRGDAALVGREQAKADDSDRVVKAARKRAVDLYTLVANDYPTDAKVDEVLYYLAYEYEQAGDLKNARTAYYDLIRKAPASRFVPHAYLAFGELFFVEAQGDPTRWDLAAQAYAEVVKYPAPRNSVQGYAYYKAAYVYWNKGDLDRSLDSFKKAISFGEANPSIPGATKLAESARRDILPVYALRGDPKMAYGFLKPISGDRAGVNDGTFRMMDDLGGAYLDTGHYAEAIALYRDLAARDRGPHACGYQARITEAVMAMRASDKDAIKTELDGLLKLYGATRGAADRTCGNRAASLVTETAMAWHLEAVGSNGQRGTLDKKTMELAARLYQQALDSFSASDLASYEFPRLVKEDWPTAFKIKYAMADLLYEQKDWSRCGPAFDAVLAEEPNAADAATPAYAAGLCYQRAYEEAHHGAPPPRAPERGFRPKDLSREQTQMLRALDRYVCTVKPAAHDAAAQAQLVEVKYTRARTYFEAQHWEEAAAAFRDIALEHAGPDGLDAAQLYLESANVLARQLGKTSCEADMAADVPRLIQLQCSGGSGDQRADGCNGLRRVQADLHRLRAQRLVEQADASGGTNLDAYAQAGTAYFELFRTACENPPKPEASGCDELAYDAAKAFQAAHLLARALAVRRALVAYDERVHMGSPLAKKAAYEIGANYQAIAAYEPAAEWFERFASAGTPARTGQDARALSDAVLLRLGLGQEAEAQKDALEFVRKFAGSRPALAGGVAFAMGAHHAEKGEWEKVRLALSSPAVSAAIDRAPPDVQAQAHATLGRALLRLGPSQAARARAEFAKVERVWADPSAAQKIRSSYPEEDDAQRERRVGRAVSAAGEALFFAAEERKALEVDALRFPEYRGPGDLASVKAHIDTQVKAWYSKKKAAIQRVEAAYAKVLDLKPKAPPRWIIAAGARAGLMWGDFVDDFRRSPIPREWRGTALEHAYTTALDERSEPFKVGHAKPALKKCLDLSVSYQYFDDFSRSCEVWLGRHFKDEYHVVDELRGAPTLPNDGLAEHAPPFTLSAGFVR